MSRFLVVRTPDHLARACVDVSALTQAWRGDASDDDASLLGVWIEHPSEPGGASALAVPVMLSAGSPPLVRASTELGGVWALCWTAPLSRAQLMDALAASVDPAARRRARFVPVFPERMLDWRTEWAELAGRHAGLVLPPILQDADGTLRLDDLGWAEGPQAVSPADARPRAIPGSSQR